MITRVSCLDHEVLLSQQSPRDMLEGFSLPADMSSIHVITDDNTFRFCLPLIQDAFDKHHHAIHRVPSGERSKTFSVVEELIVSLNASGADRASLIIGLGGGMIGDLSAFVASVYMRGIRHLLVPTSLMAMVDAAIGGKTAVNVDGVKNLAGTFKQPIAVLINPDFLKTHPSRELKSGLAEAVKHSILQQMELTERFVHPVNRSSSDWFNLIEESIRFKCDIVNRDFTDQNIRKQLNFGHTAGHVIESVSLSSNVPLLHGEAVALGMMVEAVISHRIAGLEDARMFEIIRTIRGMFFDIPAPHFTDDWPRLLTGDKKTRSGSNRFVLLGMAGEVVTDFPVPIQEVRAGIEELRAIIS